MHLNYSTGFVPTKAAELLTLQKNSIPLCHVSTASTEAPQNTGTTPAWLNFLNIKPEHFLMQSSAPSPCSFQPLPHHKSPLALGEVWPEWTAWDCLKGDFRDTSKAKAHTSTQPGAAILNNILFSFTSGLCIHGSYRGQKLFML